MWLHEPERDGASVHDGKNPNRALRDRPIMGLQILTGFVRGPEGRWQGYTLRGKTMQGDRTGRCIVDNLELDRLRWPPVADQASGHGWGRVAGREAPDRLISSREEPCLSTVSTRHAVSLGP
ncbi:MAG: hypothetical protein ABW205_03735 [Burkholderiales bacterium]